MDDDEDEEECGEEEECEIDWSRMPGMEEDEEEDQLTPTSNSNEYADLLKSLERQFQSPSTTERTEIVEAAVTSVVGSNSGGNVPFVRSRLEMSWQLKETETECDVYLPVTCGGRQCVTCQGQGSCPCRFCRGTGQLYLPSSLHTTAFLSCRICDTTGTESCRSCQGSGWIADWTDHGVHVGGGSRPNNATVSGPSSTLQP